ncbi:uncharacterized protein LOC116195007 [Punica granatum]|uniref:DUF761 domain-containing protein n=2 Tax=Punica granatum TaxID=22663 RepID=A0A218X2C8_PUNGR|nr:uncharacterized protein LOC116195007 [Punica granatum]OWM78958.1 hypothetical protein CDL15_Pgr003129 [Punica granatum]PKI42875.1 hypothetical protein CRG98_036673 [Punica granatum]
MPSSFSTTKTLIHSLFLSQVRRIARVLTGAKSFLVKVFRKGSSSKPVHFFIFFSRNKKDNKIYFGSFRLHYNWCSSRSWSVPASVLQDTFPAPVTSQVSYYYDSCSRRKYEDAVGHYCHPEPSGLSGYLQWLEEKKVDHGQGDVLGDQNNEQPQGNEIDKLADMFIARCHEKFILEKQESERRFHEMLARSM